MSNSYPPTLNISKLSMKTVQVHLIICTTLERIFVNVFRDPIHGLGLLIKGHSNSFSDRHASLKRNNIFYPLSKSCRFKANDLSLHEDLNI